MFNKKQPKEQNQSQSMSKTTINSSFVEQVQAGRDLQQTQSGNLQTQQQITNTEVIKQLEKLETEVKTSNLNQEDKDKISAYLLPAKLEAAEKESDKDLIGKNLNKVNDTLKIVKETTETGKNLWETGQEVFQEIAPWLGTAAKFIGM